MKTYRDWERLIETGRNSERLGESHEDWKGLMEAGRDSWMPGETHLESGRGSRETRRDWERLIETQKDWERLIETGSKRLRETEPERLIKTWRDS